MVDSNSKRIIPCADCGEEKKYHARGLCKQCYQRMNLARWRRNNPGRKRQSSPVVECEVCGKRKPHCARGLCESCYQHIWHLEHRDENNRKASKRYYKNRERRREQMNQWMKSNPKKMKIYQRRYYEKTKEQQAKQHLIWCRNNPEKILAKNNRRRAHKNAVANTLTVEQTEFERKIGEATYSGEKLHLHHLVPFSKGGGHTWGNIAFVPASLNGYIQDKLPEEVYKQLYLFEVAI